MVNEPVFLWERREQRGHSSLHATSGSNVYMIDQRGLRRGAWVLRKRHMNDTRWDVVAEYNTEEEAKGAAK